MWQFGNSLTPAQKGDGEGRSQTPPPRRGLHAVNEQLWHAADPQPQGAVLLLKACKYEQDFNSSYRIRGSYSWLNIGVIDRAKDPNKHCSHFPWLSATYNL